jgi:membrane associated rhomboid family serine protease
MNTYSSKSLRQFYIIPLFWALILPVLIGLLNRKFFLYGYEILSFLFLGIPVIIILQIIVDLKFHEKPITSSLFRKFTIVPPGLVYKTDLDIPNIPLVTISLIIVNCLIFFLLPESLLSQYTFFPHGETLWLQIFLSFFISAFLHANLLHLAGNMLFLLVFGSVLESRLGWKRYLAAYLFFIVASNALTLFLLTIKINTFGAGTLTDYHGLGASGAVSGLMGIFAVRCYFARLSFSFPILGWIGVPFKMPGVVLIGMYFFADNLMGAERQFSGSANVGYWAHLGGYFGGIILGYSLKLHKEAVKEALTVNSISNSLMLLKSMAKRQWIGFYPCQVP